MNSKLKYVLGIAGILLLIYGAWYFRSILIYLLIAAALAFLGQPVIRLISSIHIKQYKVPMALSATITLALMWSLLIIGVNFFIPIILSEFNEISQININSVFVGLEKPISDVQQRLIEFGLIESEQAFGELLTEKVMKFMNMDYLSSLFSGVTSTLGGILIGAFGVSFFTFFFLKDASLFTNGILLFVPDKHVDEVKHILQSIRYLLSRYLGGIVIQVLLIMILVTLGTWWVGMDFQQALICGLFSGIMNVIPYVGPWIGAIFSIALGIVTHLDMPFNPDMIQFIGLLTLVFLVVQVSDNVIFQPVIFSGTVNAHPIEIFIVILMAGSLSGIIGLVLAIPLYTILRVIAKEFFSSFKIVKNLTKNI